MRQPRTAVETRRLILMQMTAEALAMPEMVCGHRACRRDQGCQFDWTRRPEPTCLSLLRPEQRALFDELYLIVAAIHDNVHPAEPAKNPERRALEEAAMEIVRASLRTLHDIAPRFAEWHRRYATPPAPPLPPQPAAPPEPPAPPVDTGKLLAEIKAEIARNRVIDETRAETDALRQRLAAPSGGRA